MQVSRKLGAAVPLALAAAVAVAGFFGLSSGRAEPPDHAAGGSVESDVGEEPVVDSDVGEEPVEGAAEEEASEPDVPSQPRSGQEQTEPASRGKVRWVNLGSATLWIDFGHVDELPKGARFKVYGPGENAAAGRDEKGVIVVTRILAPHLAECRIDRLALSDPIVPGDRIYAADEEGKRAQPEPDAAAVAKAYEDTLAALREEVTLLRQELREAQAERDEYFQRLVELHDRLGKVMSEGRTKPPAGRKGPPAGLQGLILSTAEKGLVEVSLGSDDGLRKGHRLEVYRLQESLPKYLGRIEVQETAPDKSVCRIVSRLLLGPFQKGDRVATEVPKGLVVQVEIDANGLIRAEGKPLTMETLTDVLSALAKEYPHVTISVAAHPDVKHERVVEVIDACQKKGLRAIILKVYDDTVESGPPAALRR